MAIAVSHIYSCAVRLFKDNMDSCMFYDKMSRHSNRMMTHPLKAEEARSGRPAGLI